MRHPSFESPQPITLMLVAVDAVNAETGCGLTLLLVATQGDRNFF
ncbi:MAG: hypothetical protein ACRC62_21530 [Microcoleus sp.]